MAVSRPKAPWFVSPLLAPTADVPIGADGIAVHNGSVYVTSTPRA